MTTATTTDQRVFFSRDYARAADFIRRSRKNKTPSQIARIDQATALLAETFAADNSHFDMDTWTRHTLLRIETTKRGDFMKWAAEHGIEVPGDEHIAQHYSAFYGGTPSPAGAGQDDDQNDEN